MFYYYFTDLVLKAAQSAGITTEDDTSESTGKYMYHDQGGIVLAFQV